MTNERPPKPSNGPDRLRRLLVTGGVVTAAVAGEEATRNILAPKIRDAIEKAAALERQVSELKATVTAKDQEIAALQKTNETTRETMDKATRVADGVKRRLEVLGTILRERSGRASQPVHEILEVWDVKQSNRAEFVLTDRSSVDVEFRGRIVDNSSPDTFIANGTYKGLSLQLEMPMPKLNDRRDPALLPVKISCSSIGKVLASNVTSQGQFATILTALENDAREKLMAIRTVIRSIGLSSERAQGTGSENAVIWKHAKGPEYMISQGGQDLSLSNFGTSSTNLAYFLQKDAMVTFSTDYDNGRQFSLLFETPYIALVGSKKLNLRTLEDTEKLRKYIGGETNAVE